MNNGNAIAVRGRAKLLVLSSDFLMAGFRTQYWIDVMLLAALLLAVAALRRDAHTPPPLVAGPHGLQPFHIIQRADLLLKGHADAPPSAKEAADAVGRYSFQFVKAGDGIDARQLSQGDRLTTELKGRVLLGLKIQPTNLFAGMKPPFTASLTGAPSERATTTLFEKDVIVLDLQTQNDGVAAVLAVPAADQPTLAAFIGRSNLLLVADQR